MTRDAPRPRLVALAAALLLASAAAPAAGPETVTLVVQPGDTLIGLNARVFDGPAAWRRIARLNRLPDPNRIRPGQQLRVPVNLLRADPVPARVVAVTGDARADGAPLAEGAAVPEGARIATGDAASVVLALADGSRLRVPPSTEGELAQSRIYGAAPQPAAQTLGGWFAGVFRVVRGSVEVLAAKAQRAKPLEVTTPAVVAGVRGTEFRVHHDGAVQVSRAEVLDGIVRVDAAERPPGARPAPAGTDVAAGFGMVAAGGARPAAPVALAPAPDLAALPALFERPLVRFALPAGLGPVQVQVAADPGFDRIVSDQRLAAGAEWRVAGLADARWHLRARTLDTQGLAGRDATASFALKARPEPPASGRPRAGAKAMAGTVAFSWAPNTEAATARLQVARDAGFRDLVVDRADLPGAERSETLAEPGAYFWRLASTRADGDRGPFGDAQAFELRALPAPPEGGLADDGRSLVLRWSGRPGDAQEVQLARDPAFAEIVAEAKLDRPEWALPAPERSGRYYFRYRSVEPDGFTTPYSSTLAIDVPRDWRWLPLLLPLLLLF